MKSIFISLLVAGSFLAHSQQQNKTVSYASSGEQNFTWVGGHKYDAAKKYVVFKLWNEKENITDAEKQSLEKLKGQLAKKNIELVSFEWKTSEDLEGLFKKHGLEVDVDTNNGIRLKTGKQNFNTTSYKAMFVFEGGKPTSLCCGTKCEDNIKTFFGIIASN